MGTGKSSNDQTLKQSYHPHKLASLPGNSQMAIQENTEDYDDALLSHNGSQQKQSNSKVYRRIQPRDNSRNKVESANKTRKTGKLEKQED